MKVAIWSRSTVEFGENVVGEFPVVTPAAAKALICASKIEPSSSVKKLQVAAGKP